MEPTVYFLAGYRGIGKTHFAEKEKETKNIPFINADALEFDLKKHRNFGPYGMHWADLFHPVMMAVSHGLKVSRQVILEYPSWRDLGEQLDRIRERLTEYGLPEAKIVAVTFDTDMETAYARYVARGAISSGCIIDTKGHYQEDWEINKKTFKKYNGFFDEIISAKELKIVPCLEKVE